MQLNPRILVIGNSGAGKSTLAAALASQIDCIHVRLDDVYWRDPTLFKKRGQEAAKQMAAEHARGAAWVIEGVYGWLLDVVVPRATTLIWLDLSVRDCMAGLMQRQSYSPLSAVEFEGLLAWTAAYETRQSSSSRAGHAKIFEAFIGGKVALHQRSEAVMLGARAVAQS
jgi:adenylate kinase family enzyme